MESQSQESAWAAAVRKGRAGDRLAYEQFLQDLSAYLRRIVRYRLRTFGLDPAEAEDVVQEILIAIHTRRDQWHAERPLMPWLDAIARYKIIDAARRLRKDARGRVDFDDAQWSALPASGQHDPAMHVDVERMLSELPPAQQSVARAIGVDGASPSEAADRLGMKEGAVRVAFHRALKRLMAMAKD
ncbi:sigma-70 family RNA polymerase sigma factor [Bordetella genomosp. 13]|uniref:sigma-70 family RNA polymerase sigma factor n=1 Tax=Bordetella genomosp. 13 TaxID=463040 RepID=UPI0011A99D2A|nr:sigma-70 family RNA polymerase sigma factor [Bordetella genomosp. 13]